jgi:ABC-type glycerol-3-phosphate transport system substrate-binding protein
VTKKMAIILIVIALLLPGSISAQGNSLGVWNALSQDDSSVLARAADRFGAAVDLQYVDPPYLLDSTMSASGAGPDVIVAGNRAADPLMESGLLASVRTRDFFLSDLLGDLPSMIQQRCGDEPLERCFSGGGAMSAFTVPDRASISHTLDWLCVSSDWLPLCSGTALPGVPVSWSFSILLFDTGWLAQNGLDLPTTLDSVTEMRSQYGLSVTQADKNFLPSAGELSPDTIYQVDSTLLSEDPEGMMASLVSFHQAGYAAVVVIGIDSAYVSASAAQPDLAAQFASFLGSDLDVKVGLLSSSQRLPAFSAADLSGWGLDSNEADVTLMALILLTTYAGLAS